MFLSYASNKIRDNLAYQRYAYNYFRYHDISKLNLRVGDVRFYFERGDFPDMIHVWKVIERNEIKHKFLGIIAPYHLLNEIVNLELHC
jgi:hypothetical protein